MQEEIRRLVLAELSVNPSFIHVEVDGYLNKIFANADFICHLNPAGCRGFVAYYCNDSVTQSAFITLLLVTPEERGTGLARSLVHGVFDEARRKSFNKCRLEVASDNERAIRFYQSMGFQATSSDSQRLQLEISLS